MTQLGRNKPWQDAWRENFGDDAQAFEQKWRDYWTKLPDHPTLDLYAKANVATLTSFLGRAWAQKQTFESFGSFIDAASNGRLKAYPEDWLPPGLLADALDQLEQQRKLGCSYSFLLEDGPRLPLVRCALPDGRQIVGKFAVKNGRIASVSADARRAASSQP
jgi:hypothetical protein